MGAYHGERSFLQFSHEKAVLYKYNFLDVFARYPPYTGLKQSILGVLQMPRPRWLMRLLTAVAAYFLVQLCRTPLKALLMLLHNVL
jgi:hypothetical protein